MEDPRDIVQLAGELATRGEPFVLMTVIATKGSTPRNAGAKMIWRPGAGLTGTIGGGQFEQLVEESAERRFVDRDTGTEEFVLGAESEQCCGGRMDVLYEYVGPARRLVLFGAGHVSKALVDVLQGGGCEIHIVDDRSTWNSDERFLGCSRVQDWDKGIVLATERPEETLVCVMTCSHETDFRVLRDLLMSEGAPAFIGLIGSRSKRVNLFSRLVGSGCNEKSVKQVHCPIGVGDCGKAPRFVAISIAAQLLLEAKRLDQL